jgi:hypothetical protein
MPAAPSPREAVILQIWRLPSATRTDWLRRPPKNPQSI